MGPPFLPYAAEILKIVIKNVYDQNVHRRIKLACISTLGEVALSPLKNEVLPHLTSDILAVGPTTTPPRQLSYRRIAMSWGSRGESKRQHHSQNLYCYVLPLRRGIGWISFLHNQLWEAVFPPDTGRS